MRPARTRERGRRVGLVAVVERSRRSAGECGLRAGVDGAIGADGGCCSGPGTPATQRRGGAVRRSGGGGGNATGEADLFVPNADAGSRLLMTGVVLCRLTCAVLLLRLGV